MLNKISKQAIWQNCSITALPELDTNDIHVWYVRLDLDPGQARQAIGWLNAHQQEKYNRRFSQDLKESYLAGRYYLFKFLEGYSGTDAGDLNLAYTKLDKPFLQQNHSSGFHQFRYG